MNGIEDNLLVVDSCSRVTRYAGVDLGQGSHARSNVPLPFQVPPLKTVATTIGPDPGLGTALARWLRQRELIVRPARRGFSGEGRGLVPSDCSKRE